MEGGFVFFLIVAAVAAVKIIQAINDNKLLHENPKAWKAKKLVEAETKRRKLASQANLGVSIGTKLARRLFMK